MDSGRKPVPRARRLPPKTKVACLQNKGHWPPKTKGNNSCREACGEENREEYERSKRSKRSKRSRSKRSTGGGAKGVSGGVRSGLATDTGETKC